MVGSYLLSGENAQIYYNKALSIREDMRKDPINVQLISEPSVPLLRNIRSIKLPKAIMLMSMKEE